MRSGLVSTTTSDMVDSIGFPPANPATGYSNGNETVYSRRGCRDFEATWF